MQKAREVLRNTPKYHFVSNGVEWMLRNFGTRNSASCPKHKFSSFYKPKVSETLQNTPKQHFGFDGVESMLRYVGAPK
jgi:hypothetical protein